VTLIIDVAVEGVRVPLARARVVALARGALHAEGERRALLSITFVDQRSISRLNRQHLGHRGATDVISFGFVRRESLDPVMGDVYICTDVARVNARAHGASVREELARLVIHGVLHVLGHDHPGGDDRLSSPMWRRQEQLLGRLSPAWRT